MLYESLCYSHSYSLYNSNWNLPYLIDIDTAFGIALYRYNSLSPIIFSAFNIKYILSVWALVWIQWFQMQRHLYPLKLKYELSYYILHFYTPRIYLVSKYHEDTCQGQPKTSDFNQVVL